MKKRERAIIVFFVLLFLWGTILTGPFKYFGWMSRDIAYFLMVKIGAGGDFGVFTAYVVCILCMTALFLLGRSKDRRMVTPVCAAASLFFYLVQSGNLQTIPVYIAVALLLALIAAVVNTNILELWLADFFILSIPVMILYDALFVPMFSFLKIDTGLLAPWIDIPKTSVFMTVTLLNWPVMIWGAIITAAAMVPAVIFTSSKTRGK